SDEDAGLAAKNGVCLEITSRNGHSKTNGHVVNAARRAGAKVVVQSDIHSPDDIISENMRNLVALGAGMSKDEAKTVLSRTSKEILNR
ncbi:MAG: PHP domain-containing protein, partial [Methanocorpusculum sp.]|nr:PHP domain-containing protein [Methanocorpusculum sp.]